VTAPSTNLKNLVLALFLCLGMIGLSGSGIGPTCAEKAQKACGCCPMSPEETCCSAADERVPVETPIVPAGAAQQQVFQAIQFARPLLMMLPVAAASDFPRISQHPSLSSTGPSVQALLCMRMV
jgi:hypothetical protein